MPAQDPAPPRAAPPVVGAPSATVPPPALRRRHVVRSRLGMWRLHLPSRARGGFDVLMDGITATVDRVPDDRSP